MTIYIPYMVMVIEKSNNGSRKKNGKHDNNNGNKKNTYKSDNVKNHH